MHRLLGLHAQGVGLVIIFAHIGKTFDVNDFFMLKEWASFGSLVFVEKKKCLARRVGRWEES